MTSLAYALTLSRAARAGRSRRLRALELIDEPGDERRFRPDDREIGSLAFGSGPRRRDSPNPTSLIVRAFPRDAGVAGRALHSGSCGDAA